VTPAHFLLQSDNNTHYYKQTQRMSNLSDVAASLVAPIYRDVSGAIISPANLIPTACVTSQGQSVALPRLLYNEKQEEFVQFISTVPSSSMPALVQDIKAQQQPARPQPPQPTNQ
jgi:hypothetical protein